MCLGPGELHVNRSSTKVYLYSNAMGDIDHRTAYLAKQLNRRATLCQLRTMIVLTIMIYVSATTNCRVFAVYGTKNQAQGLMIL
ncbi:hypothetical protein HD806DRAFT_515490 [Xylariaceae sp. AK1471]|nr:hypothetical protein HD806DRAFT_515490 [Xylariaceae sp. AK1471]